MNVLNEFFFFVHDLKCTKNMTGVAAGRFFPPGLLFVLLWEGKQKHKTKMHIKYD